MKIVLTVEHLPSPSDDARVFVYALTRLLGALPRGVRWAIHVER